MAMYRDDSSTGIRFQRFNPFSLLLKNGKDLDEYPIVRVRFNNNEQMQTDWHLMMVKKGWAFVAKEKGANLEKGIMSVTTLFLLNPNLTVPEDLIEISNKFSH